jgi:hypothetical protein
MDAPAEYPPGSGISIWATVDFSENGGTVGTAPSDIHYNLFESAWEDGTSFPSGVPARSGYEFDSWNTAADGTGSAVNDLTDIGTVTGNLTLLHSGQLT